MNSATSTQEIERQRQLVFNKQPAINIVAPCKLHDGVIRHSTFEKNRYMLSFLQSSDEVRFFIPASGSGSRMFQFLYDFLSYPSEETRGKTERFLNAIEDFAFFELLPFELKEKVRNYTIDLDDFVSYLLKEEGLGLGIMPKGLLPFHRSRSFILNAFQEQLLQGIRLREKNVDFHFTINPVFDAEIQQTLNSVKELTGRKCETTTSHQDPTTDAIAFDINQDPVHRSSGELLTRPSGHGALLNNLNQQRADILFIKNIDNVQHESRADTSVDTLRYLGGLLQVIRDELKAIYNQSEPHEKLVKLNEKYQIFDASTEFSKLSRRDLIALINKPLRVCGMVRNEGQPGGGPFWVEENGKKSKQIVEKSQIDMKGNQYRLMVQSQFFNPVLMAVSTKDFDDEYFNLHDFCDEEKYFIVDKKFEGNPIQFMERPGLWNGSMADWLTVFVEVPSATFTPVKTALDLLTPEHRDLEK